MKTHTPQFKEAIKEFGREVDVKISYGDTTLDSEQLNSLKPTFNVELFKTIMKSVEFDSNIKIPTKTWVTPEFGVKVGSAYEYLNYGEYYINDEPEYSADNNGYIHKGYDRMIESMIYHDENPLEIIYPISYKNFIQEIANKLGWTFNQTGFPNEDTMIEDDLYSDLGLTYRDILDDICPASMGNFIVTDNKELKIIYPTETGDTINEEYLKDTNVNVLKKVGAINSLVLSRAEDADTINRIDADSIDENGLKEIKIKDSILLSSEFRENFIDEMFDKIKGFEYYSIDVSSTGIGYYEPLDRFTMAIGGKEYSVVLLNSELNIEDGIVENLFSPELEESTTNYDTSSTTDKSEKMATILAYKNQAKIKLMTKQTNDNIGKISEILIDTDSIKANIEKNQYYIDENGEKHLISEKVFSLDKTVDGMNLQFKQVGGYNLLDNCVKQFGNTGYSGSFLNYTNTEIQNNSLSKSALFFINGTDKKVINNIPNGTYNYSLKYKKLIDLAVCTVSINGQVINLDSLAWQEKELTFEVNSNTVEIIYQSNTNNSCYAVDILLIPGSIKQVWSANPNEIYNASTKMWEGNLEIDSDASNTKFRAGTDGTRVINKTTNQTTAEFTDKGTVTDELTANKAEIAGLSISKKIVDGEPQTWFSM